MTEKTALTVHGQTSDNDMVPLPDIVWLPRKWHPGDARLLAALLDARRRVGALMPGLHPSIASACIALLQRAEAEAVRHVRYVAWGCLHQLDEELLGAMRDEERAVCWCALRAEAAEKLKGSWRGKAAEYIATLVTDEKAVPLHLVRELQRQLATQAQNQHYKLDLLQRSLPWVTALLAIAAIGFFALELSVLDWAKFASSLSSGQAVSSWGKDDVPWAWALVLGIPAGALGGILSMAFSFGRADVSAKIPEMRLSILVTVTRPLLGATVAIPVAVFTQAGYVTVAGFGGPLGIFAFCFLGGFSERWFLNVMERFEASKEEGRK